MKKLQMRSAHRELIFSVIKENPKIRGNEELTDMICEAVYKKSYLLLDAIKDTARIKRHLVSICDGCMEQIIKEKQIFNKALAQTMPNLRPKKPPMPSYQKPTNIKKEKLPRLDLITPSKPKEEKEIYSPAKNFDAIIDPIKYIPDNEVSASTVAKLVQIVKNIDDLNPKKKYFEIFSLRYIRGLNQMQTALELKISQVELSKRFVELIKLTRDASIKLKN